MIRKQNVYIVYGPPASGKSTFALSHMTERDILVDMDSLVGALTKTHQKHLDRLHPDYSRVMPVALHIRDVLYAAIKSRIGTWENAYIVTSQWNEERITELAKYLRAECVFMNIPENECIRRAQEDEARPDKEKESRIIHEWFYKRRHLS